MRAADIRGQHPGWKEYLNGPPDYEALQRVHGIGPARADLVLRVYGSVDRFLQAEAADVARRTRSVMGPRLARTLQSRCRAAGVRSDWSRLEALAAADDDGEPSGPPYLERLSALGQDWFGRLRELWVTGHAVLDRLGTGR